jgi:hypothetical protein
MPRRSRRRWLVAAAVAACWLALVVETDSVLAATMLLIVLAVLGVVTVLGLRAVGITRDHPWVRRLAERPWRDGQDVFGIALRHLAEVFVITPSGSVLAPDLVELRMNPQDLESLSERIEPGVVSESAFEAYLDQVAARGARLSGHARPEVRVIADPSVPAGRYRLRQGQPVGQQTAGSPGRPAPPAPYPGFVGHDGKTRTNAGLDEPRTKAEQLARTAAGSGLPTVAELDSHQVPVLRLVTGDTVVQTRTSGARAGRGAVELRLPQVPTLSREHARFTFSDGQWRIANLGQNGLTLNGQPLAGEQPLEDGDVIRWGMKWNALLSRVEIG